MVKIKNTISTSYMSVGKKTGFKNSKVLLNPGRTYSGYMHIYFIFL